MIIFKDIISGDEMFTDSVPYKLEDGFYVVESKFVQVTEGQIVLAGSNPSAEDAPEDDCEAATESGVDLILAHRMKETGFGTKADYKAYMKSYMKAIFGKIEGSKCDEEVKRLKEGATQAYKVALGKFKDLQFYTGESMNPDASCALLEWVDREGGQTPVLYFYEASLHQEKV